jgi:hypothetical protein
MLEIARPCRYAKSCNSHDPLDDTKIRTQMSIFEKLHTPCLVLVKSRIFELWHVFWTKDFYL